MVALAQGDYDQARARLEEGLAMWREAGNRALVPTSLNNLGLLAAVQGEYAQAISLLEESLRMCRESGEKLGVAFALLNLGLAVSGQGDYERAGSLYRQSLAIFRELGDRLHIATALARLAALSVVQSLPLDKPLALSDANGEAKGPKPAPENSDLVRAATLAGAAEGLLDKLSVPLPPFERPYYGPAMRAARAQLGEQAFEAAWAQGRAMTPDQAADYALEEAHAAQGQSLTPGS
jgi:tetratricopeptide (TPR) repeat protein